MIPKPPARIRDKKLLARFAACRMWCQSCGSTRDLQIHHLTDTPDCHRRSDVWDNLMRLCADCHTTKFHSEGKWTKPELRDRRKRDEGFFRCVYSDREAAYDDHMSDL